MADEAEDGGPRTARLWRALRLLAARIRVPADPLADGLKGFWERMAEVAEVRQRVVRLAGRVLRARGNARAKLVRLRRSRRRLEDACLASPTARTQGDSVTERKAKVAWFHLRGEDDEIAATEAVLEELDAVREFLTHTLDLAVAAKEVMRQQTDLLRGERALGAD